MSVRSKFERKLTFRNLGFAYKIPDCGRSLKPFDYVVGIPIKRDNAHRMLRFVAIEAKKANGWTLPQSAMLDHQVRALDYIERLSRFSSWVAVGFLDAPKMKLDWNRSKIVNSVSATAFLIPWIICKRLMFEGSLSYKDLIELYGEYMMDYGPYKSSYKWTVGKSHPIHELIK